MLGAPFLSRETCSSPCFMSIWSRRRPTSSDTNRWFLLQHLPEAVDAMEKTLKLIEQVQLTDRRQLLAYMRFVNLYAAIPIHSCNARLSTSNWDRTSGEKSSRFAGAMCPAG